MNPDDPQPSAKPPPTAGAGSRRQRSTVGPGDLQALTQACLSDDLPAALAVCAGLQSRGTSVRDRRWHATLESCGVPTTATSST